MILVMCEKYVAVDSWRKHTTFRKKINFKKKEPVRSWENERESYLFFSKKLKKNQQISIFSVSFHLLATSYFSKKFIDFTGPFCHFPQLLSPSFPAHPESHTRVQSRFSTQFS